MTSLLVSVVPLLCFILLTVLRTGHGNRMCVCMQNVFNATVQPIGLVQEKVGSKRFYLAEQRGMVYSYSTSWTDKTLFVDVSSLVVYEDNLADERGLLGFALHPNFDTNGRFFIYTVRNVSDGQFSFVSEMIHGRNGVDIKAEKTLLVIKQPGNTRNGGQLFFGKDGYLYIAVGDGGVKSGADAEAVQAQDGTSLLGKILRIDVDKTQYDRESNTIKDYSFPVDNPFVGNSSFKPEIFALGFRNPWRCGVDKENGDIYCGDLGSNDMEEIDLIESGGNYGWNFREGTKCMISDCSNRTETLPIYAYDHGTNGPGAAVIGGYMYRGKSIKYLQGKYLYADVVRMNLYSLSKSGNSWNSSILDLCPVNQCPCGARHKPGLLVLSFAQDNEGELYVLTTSAFHGQTKNDPILKLIPKHTGIQATCGAGYLSTNIIFVFFFALLYFL